TSVATAVAAGATGAGGVIAIIAAVKAASKLVQNIRNHLQSASEVYTTIRSDVVALLGQYDKVTNTAREVAAEFAEKFLTLQVKSIGRVETNLDLFSKKLQGVEVEAHNVSGVLSKLLDQQDKLIADIKTAPPDKKKKLEDALTKIEKITNDTIIQIIAF